MENNRTVRYSGKLLWGLALLAGSLLAELVVSGYSLSMLGVDIDPNTLSSGAARVNPLQIALSCLSPLSFVLKLVAIILIVQDSARLNSLTNGWQRRMAWIAAIAFAISLVASLGSMLLSFGATTSGSVGSLQLAMWIGLAASLLGFLVTVLLVFLLMPRLARILLVVGLLVYSVASVGTSLMTMQATTLEKFDVMGNSMYVPSLELDRNQGLFPILAIAGTLAIGLTFVTLLVPTFSAWREHQRELPDSVA